MKRSYSMAYDLLWGNVLFGETEFHRLGLVRLAPSLLMTYPELAPHWERLIADATTANKLYRGGDLVNARKLVWQVVEVIFFLFLPYIQKRATLLCEQLKSEQRGEDAIVELELSRKVEFHYGERLRRAFRSVDLASQVLGIPPALITY